MLCCNKQLQAKVEADFEVFFNGDESKSAKSEATFSSIKNNQKCCKKHLRINSSC